jgi:hypothetical protein
MMILACQLPFWRHAYSPPSAFTSAHPHQHGECALSSPLVSQIFTQTIAFSRVASIGPPDFSYGRTTLPQLPKMAPSEPPKDAQAPSTSSTLREQGNALYRAGKIPLGTLLLPEAVLTVLTKLSQLARNT